MFPYSFHYLINNLYYLKDFNEYIVTLIFYVLKVGFASLKFFILICMILIILVLNLLHGTINIYFLDSSLVLFCFHFFFTIYSLIFLYIIIITLFLNLIDLVLLTFLYNQLLFYFVVSFVLAIYFSFIKIH